MTGEKVFRYISIVSIAALIAILSSRFHIRADLTPDKNFSLSVYTRESLQKLDSGISITWYRSNELASLAPSVRYIEDMLSEYREASNGLVGYSIIEPAITHMPVKPEDLGLIARQIEFPQNNGTVTKNLYSGLVLEYNEESRVIPFLIDAETIEYDLTRMIQELRNAHVRSGINTVQLVYGNGQNRDMYRYVEPWVAYAGYRIVTLEVPIGTLDPTLGLIVIGSNYLDESSAKAIDSFIQAGGSAVFFVSGARVATEGNWAATPKNTDFLLGLLSKYGFDIQSELLLDIVNFRISMPSLDGTDNIYINYPFWITVPTEAPKDNSILLSGISALQFFWPSPLTISDNRSAPFTRIAQSSPESITMIPPFSTDPFDNQITLFSENRVRGPGTLIVSQESPSRIIVIADEYFPSTLIEYTNSETNLGFLVNCVEWISGKDSLIELKKHTANRTVPENLTPRGTHLVGVSRLINMVILPACVICLFTVMTLIRRRNR